MTTNKKIAPRKVAAKAVKSPVADKATIEAKIATPSVTTPKPTIKSLQAELSTANALVEMLELGIANTKEIANQNAAIASQSATEKAIYKDRYFEEINRSWWDITKERFVESLYRFKV